jgi:spermidine synthase
MEEEQPWGKTIYAVQPGSHIHFQTTKQTVDLITNPHFGRMLFLDGALQSSTADEHMYHQPLVLNGMGYRQQPRVLIAGGAEGATLREVQNNDGANNLGVETIVMVDWDEQLVKHMDNEEPWSQGSFDDPRLTLHFEDIVTYLTSQTQPFSTIILDLLDISSNTDLVWMQDILEKSMNLLESKGGLSMNIGRDIAKASECIDFVRQKWPDTECSMHQLMIPSFQEIWWIVSIQKTN